MKKLFSVVALVGLVGASAPVLAAVTVAADAPAIAQKALGIDALKAVAAGATQAGQISQAVGAANAGHAFKLVSPVMAALTSTNSKITTANHDEIAAIVNESGAVAPAAFEAIAESIKTTGSFNAAAARAAVAAVVAQGTSNDLMPSVASALSTSEFMARYNKVSEYGSVLDERFETTEGEQATAEMLQLALVKGAEHCPTTDIKACQAVPLAGVEAWTAAGYPEKGPATKKFAAEALNGFIGTEEQNLAPVPQYQGGFRNANEAIVRAKRSGASKLPSSLIPLDTCLSTGKSTI